ncbi:AraC family transcriptional regulator [Enterobacter asburiae]|uniref:AraC family transcriptional regulator n=1 Tax=unclassified Scandinavium TaxID=2830652 RepID=UPI00289BCCFE|nr:AraC family transcriptional regulator [Scandinavium sp.]
MGDSQLLERITLEHQAISFNRMWGSSALYYHWHQCVEFLYISQGYGIVVVDNQHYTARPGRLFIFPPFRLHKVHVDDGERNHYHRSTMHIEQSAVESTLQQFPRFQAQFSRLAASGAPAQAIDLHQHADYMETILTRFAALDCREHYPADEVAFLVMQIMSLLPEQSAENRPQQQTASAQIMQWLEEHYGEKFSLEALAGDIGLSRSYTSRIFRQQTGGSIHEYLLTRRLKRSCDLLRTSEMSVDAIATKVGFQDVTYFITCFKRMMHQTPLQYRKQARLRISVL